MTYKNSILHGENCLRQLFNLPYKTPSRYLSLLCNDLLVDLQLLLRFNKFMYKILTSENACVKLASKFALNGRQSSIGKMCYIYPSYYTVMKLCFIIPTPV